LKYTVANSLRRKKQTSIGEWLADPCEFSVRSRLFLKQHQRREKGLHSWILRSGVHDGMEIKMAGYDVSNVAICARMPELGIPSISDKLRIGHPRIRKSQTHGGVDGEVQRSWVEHNDKEILKSYKMLQCI